VIEISKALKIIEQQVKPLGSQRVTLDQAAGRILREDVRADTDLPPFDRSQMDGYAVIASDTVSFPARLSIAGESAAGKGWHNKLKRGQAVRIMTGAPVPAGADAVQKVELTRESEGMVEILGPAKKGQNIVRRASEIKKGARVFKMGDVITRNMIATLASFGYSKVKVSKSPRLTIMGTGSEIVEISKKPGRDQIRNSNSVMLDVLGRGLNAETTVVPIVRDDIERLEAAINMAASTSDMLVMTGGVSVGKYDHTKAALRGLGAEIFFEKIRLKPGKPAVFAKLGKTVIFGLPGNPVSAAVTFHLFVRKALLQMQCASNSDLKKGFAMLGSAAKGTRERDTYLPAHVETNRSGMLTAHPLKWQGSSDFIGFALADSLIFVPRGTTIQAGDVATVAFI
jgi:molybdenum cofactor synthesis domain-containing protein